MQKEIKNNKIMDRKRAKKILTFLLVAILAFISINLTIFQDKNVKSQNNSQPAQKPSLDDKNSINNQDFERTTVISRFEDTNPTKPSFYGKVIPYSNFQDNNVEIGDGEEAFSNIPQNTHLKIENERTYNAPSQYPRFQSQNYVTRDGSSDDFHYDYEEFENIHAQVRNTISFDENFEENSKISDCEKTRKYLPRSYNPVLIKFPEIQIDAEKAKMIEDYLKPSYSNENFPFKTGQNEETIKEYLRNIEIPEEIVRELIHLDFKYRLQPKKKKGFFITKITWDQIKENICDKSKKNENQNQNENNDEGLENKKENNIFIRKIIRLIKTVKFFELEKTNSEEEEMSKFLLDFNHNETEIYGDNKFNNSDLYLDLTKVEFHKKKINKYNNAVIKNNDLTKEKFKEQKLNDNNKSVIKYNDFEKKINDNFKFVLCDERLEQIDNFLEKHGLVVPEELTDRCNISLIKDPVLLDYKDDYFFDKRTLEEILKKDDPTHPFRQEPLQLYENLNNEEKIIYDQKINEQKLKLKIFNEKIGNTFKNYFRERYKKKGSEMQIENKLFVVKL